MLAIITITGFYGFLASVVIPEACTRFYDTVTSVLLKVDPNLKFMALSLADPIKGMPMFEYFLNPANHKAGVPLDFITYHFYAMPPADQTIG
jgi:hypothetical protein